MTAFAARKGGPCNENVTESGQKYVGLMWRRELPVCCITGSRAALPYPENDRGPKPHRHDEVMASITYLIRLDAPIRHRTRVVQKQSVADNDRNDGPGSPRGWSASLKAAGAQARIQDLTAGLLLALVTFAYSVSFGALIFSGRLAEYSGLGVVSALLSAALATLVIARFSSFRHALAGPDTPVAAILSALAIGVAGVSPVEASAGQVLANVVMALIICSVITACLLTAVGVFRLSKWMRFIPYTVVAGFLAASGWFLIDGAAIMMVGEPMHDALPLVLEQGVWHSPLIAAALFGAGIWGLQVITKSPSSAPVPDNHTPGR